MSAACPTFGFVVEIEVRRALSSHLVEALRRDFAEIADRRGLVARGGGGAHTLTYRVQSEAAQPTEADREAIEAWAASRAEIASARVGELLDLSSG